MNKIGFVIITALIMLLSIVCISAELDLKITATLNSAETDFYSQTDPSSNSGIDYLDFEKKDFPSGNYSFMYSLVSSKNLLIDSWNTTGNPRTLNLTYITNPAVSGTLTLSWSTSFGSSLYVYLQDYGNDSAYTSLVSQQDMASVSSYSASVASADGTRRYFRLVVGNTAASVPSSGTIGGGGSTTEQKCEVIKCSPSVVKCGNPVYDNCGGLCATGTLCMQGYCDLIKKSCCSDTCISLGLECGTHKMCNNEIACGSCSSGFCSEEGKCLKECAPACADKECGDDGCLGSCGSCSAGDSCYTGKCREGKQLPDEKIPADLARIGGETCESKNIVCGDFSACEINYNVDGLITGRGVAGIKIQQCRDKNGCYADFEISEECYLKDEVKVRNKKWCNEQFTEISDNSGKILARMKPIGAGKFVKVELNAEGSGYCFYCYDGIKNYDEADVDCGGSCGICGSQSALEYSYIPKITMLPILGVAFLALLVLLFFIARSQRDSITAFKRYLKKKF